ncbi:MAG: polyamine aminopropyltransferase [Deltaproteobacteria bacterium]|nr:MAG: polyamine aminopropyltransferase [Deltaproteobacteria bacterium]
MNISASFILYLATFIMGGCGLAYEYTLSRVATDLLGNSARQWALVIGAMMFCMGIGADFQKRLDDNLLLDKFIGAEIMLGLLGGCGPLALLFTYGIAPSYYIVVQYTFIGSIGLLLGFELPMIARLNSVYIHQLEINLGKILKMDYVGALAGALVWVFLLPRFFTLIETAFVLGLLNLGAATVLLLYFRSKVTLNKRLWSAVLAVSMILTCSLFQARNWTSTAEQYLYLNRIILSRTTRFQHIVLTQSRASEISCYINGSLQFNSADEYIYHENLVHPAFALAPHQRRVLILGGGDGLAAREVLKYPRVKELVLCDLDPEMTDLARKHPTFIELNQGSLNSARITILKNNHLISKDEKEAILIPNQHRSFGSQPEEVAQVSLINLDAATLLEKLAGKFDIIIVDFPDPNNEELAKLYSKTFYHRLSDRLAIDGIFVQQATSPYHAREAFLCIGRSMTAAGLSVIPYHDNVPSFGEWGWWIGGHKKRWATKELPKSLKETLKKTTTLAVSTRYLTPELIHASLDFGKNQLVTKEIEINTLVNHKIFTYYLQGWQTGY